MHGHAAQGRQAAGANGSYDVGMGAHAAIMHFALSDCKRLLRHGTHYASTMDTPNARLRKAREKFFDTAKLAAEAMGVPVSTYIGHENGRRGFPAKRAPQYAKKFKTTEEWLLYGKGPEAQPDPLPSVTVLEQMIGEVLAAEATVETRLADLPRIVGSALHEQLERYVADPKVVDLWAERNARDKGAQSRQPTKRDEQGGSRTA